MNKCLILALVATIGLTACTPRSAPVEKENPDLGAVNTSNRFEVEHIELDLLTSEKIIFDKSTGERYLFVISDNAGGLVHLEEPKPVVETVEPVEEVVEVIFDNNYDNMIYQAAKDVDVDPYLAIAISRLETGHYTSTAFIEGNNFGGITIRGEVASFDSLASGLDRYVSLLGWYSRNGMTTAETMQSTYCPPNENWDEIVNEIYESMVSEVK